LKGVGLTGRIKGDVLAAVETLLKTAGRAWLLSPAAIDGVDVEITFLVLADAERH
jgi:hypothetical protein